MLILLMLSDQLHLRSPSAVCHHVCVCFNDGYLRAPLCHIAQYKNFFPAHHDSMEPPWQQLGPRRLGGQLQATDGTHTHTHTHTHTIVPPTPVFCFQNSGNISYFPVIWDQSTFNGFIKKNTQWHSPLVTQLFQYSRGNLVGPLGLFFFFN